MALKEYCAAYWLTELEESLDMCTGRITDITEILFVHRSVCRQSLCGNACLIFIAKLEKKSSNCKGGLIFLGKKLIEHLIFFFQAERSNNEISSDEILLKQVSELHFGVICVKLT